MSGQISICYRREDSAYAAGRLFDRLSQRFGADNIFMDIDAIELGIDFVQRIREAVSACDVLVAIIGRQWINATDAREHRRLDNPNDFIRIELEAALERDIHVIPALVEGAIMPLEEELPEALAPLARRNGLIIGHTRFDSDVDRLIRGLEAIIKVATEQKAAEAERIAAEEAEAKRIAEEKAEAERQAAIKAEAEAERQAAIKAEAERIATEEAEAKRIAEERAEAERIAAEKAEADRQAAIKADAERIAAEKAEAERIAAEKAEAERQAAIKAETERIAAEKAEAERIAAEKVKAEKQAAVEAETGDAERLTPQPQKKLWGRIPIWGWVFGGLVIVGLLIGVLVGDEGLKMFASRAISTPTPSQTATPQTRDLATSTITAVTLKTRTPTVTMDADPTVYDNFNNPDYDGKINETLWDFYMDNGTGQIYQKDGILALSRDAIPDGSLDGYSGIGITARNFTGMIIENPIFIEAKLRMDSHQNGTVYVSVSFFPNSGGQYDSVCPLGFGDYQADLICFFVDNRENVYSTHVMSGNFGTWHTARIEFDPAIVKFTYYFDGQEVGTYVPTNADELKKAEASIGVGIGCYEADALTGYIDDVRIGEIEQ